MPNQKLNSSGAAQLPEGLGSALAVGQIGIIECDHSWTIRWSNEAAQSLLSPQGTAITGQNLHGWLKPSEKLKPMSEFREILLADGTSTYAILTISETADGFVAQLAPADHIGKRLTKLAYRESTWRHAIEAAGHGVWDYNANNQAQFYSAGWKRLRGIPGDASFEDDYDRWIARLHPDDRDDVIERVRRHNTGEANEFSFEYRERHTAGHYVWILASGRAVEWDSTGHPTRLIGSDIDITALKVEEQQRADEMKQLHQAHVLDLERAHQQSELARQIANQLARQDPLTALPNRRVFSDEIARLMPSENNGHPFAVLLVDLDHFKPVNDLYGHVTGDLIIRTSAERLLEIVGNSGTIARLGGDEFGVIIEAEANRLSTLAEALANKIIAAVSQPISIGGFQVEIGASVGIALYPEHGADPTCLFRNADMALYDVKQAGRGRVRFYALSMGQKAEEKAVLESSTRSAVTNEEISPHFQPIIDLRTNKIVALEVLARWTSKTLGSVPPDRFISIIDQYNLMPQFTLSMLRQTCAAAKTWPEATPFSINLTSKEVCDLSTPIRMLEVLAQHDLPATRLKIEVTEQALMQDLFTAKQVIGAFRNAGVQVMLDDFGAGYAGLGYLRELKFDSIKIDRSFVMTLLRQEESAKIVWIMQTLADTLGLKTVAEGIEDQKTLDAIQSIGCNYGQGYHFSRPVPLADVPSLFLNAPLASRKVA